MLFRLTITALLTMLYLQSGAQDLTASLSAPAVVKPGDEYVVEITIKKSPSTGFMKYFSEVPEGSIATNIDSKGGNFTFSDRAVKIVWIAPPAEAEFTISYKLSSLPSFTGSKNMSAKVSYIMQNERYTFEIPDFQIVFGKAAPGIANKAMSKESPKQEVNQKTEPEPEKPKAEIAKESPTPVSEPEKKDAAEIKNVPAEVAVTEKKEETLPEKAVIPEPEKLTDEPAKKEIKAEETAISEKPVSAAPSSDGKIYKVQFGAFSAKPKIDGIKEVSTYVLENGITKYFTGAFSKIDDAKKRQNEMIAKGFAGSFIVAFENGKIVK